MQASTSWDDVAFSSTEGDRHPGIRPVSQLNTWPVVSPVNASRLPSRAETRASLGVVGVLPLLFFASFLAHSVPGSKLIWAFGLEMSAFTPATDLESAHTMLNDI